MTPSSFLAPSAPLSPFARKLNELYRTCFEARVGISDAWEQIAKLAADEVPIRCSECKELEHQLHLPDCHRDGKVTIDSDHRFGGKSLQVLMEQCQDNLRLHNEVARLRKILETAPHDNRCSKVRLRGPDQCDCWQRDIKLESPSDTFAAGCIDWCGSLADENEETRL